ncbi:unnamed protein product [Strongylus vulgaris]|uniref:Uncharacterized protein n=1 Tax=Strongylus vulgaris TaxID=40348 RepID=A0A3P7IK71_STRVU|nr:unnamed protein product [Strongylus vulgaris]
MDLAVVDFPISVVFPRDAFLVEIEGNPMLPIAWLRKMKKRCPKCKVEEASACGLTTREYTDKQLAIACAGKTVIRPATGFYLTISSQYVTEEEMNLMCSKAVYMEICILITDSRYKRLRCPHLKELKPCLPDRPAITIMDNPFFQEFVIPTTVVYPKGHQIVQISGNPMLNPNIPQKYRPWCNNCVITLDYACGITTPTFTMKELVTACAGKKYIVPAPGVKLFVTAQDVTENELNLLCSRAVYMEICIDIVNSDIRSFRCPHLKELRSCQKSKRN